MRGVRQRPKTVLRGILGAGVMLINHAAWAEPSGVRHRIDAMVSVETGSSLFSRLEAKGFLTIHVRILANSRELRFFGTLTPTFSNVAIPQKPAVLVAQTKIWEEDICHQRRGLPKVTVTRLIGKFGQDKDVVDVVSTVRTRGQRIPPDELTPGINRPSGTDDIGQYYEFRAHTRDSRLSVDLRIYSFECRL
jgi:hypothetical protein